MLLAIWNKSCKQHPTKQQLYGHLPPILKPHPNRTYKICRTLLEKQGRTRTWLSPIHGPASVGWLARTYSHQLCADTGCRLEDLPGAMDDRDGWRDREPGKSLLSAWFDGDHDDMSWYLKFWLVWLFGFYVISTYVGYLMPNPLQIISSI